MISGFDLEVRIEVNGKSDGSRSGVKHMDDWCLSIIQDIYLHDESGRLHEELA